MKIHGIKVENIESFNDERAIRKLNIGILLANHKKYRVAYNEDKEIIFIDKRTDFEVYTVNIKDLSGDELEAIDIAFNSNIREQKYNILFTCKPDEYVYALLPTMIDEGENERFTFKTSDIHYLKVERIYGRDDTYVLTDLIEVKDNPRRIVGIPNVFCFQNICDAVTACKITPDDGYECILQFCDNCEKYIKYKYKANTGYDYKSVIPYEFLVDYELYGNTFVYGLEFDTDKETAFTYSLPLAINENTGKIILEFGECRADSMDKNGINISINNERISITRAGAKVSFYIEEI